MCEQQYYIDYVLGHHGKANIKADKGTIVHKVLELLAVLKHAKQENKRIFVDDEVYGKTNVKAFEKIKIDHITEEVYRFYSKQLPHHEWSTKDLKDCKNWVNRALTLNGGMFDPRNRTIVQPEQKFDFVIEEDWAKYSFMREGQLLEGNLCLKGTIDLITEISPDFYEIVDWKTGRRLNWATGKEKTYDSLCKDPQLRIYHYAASMIYPNVDHIMITIYFINDGGPFTVSFSKKDLDETKEMLKTKFDKIKSTQIPRLSKTWKCQKFCYFGKNAFEKPLIETRHGQFTKKGEPMTMCQEIDFQMKNKGMEWVDKHYTKKGHNVADYKAPGKVE